MISGIEFSKLGDWLLDPRYKQKPLSTIASRNNDIIFINGDNLDQFLEFYKPFATKKFRFIIHNSDCTFDADRLARLLPFSTHIYAINTNVSHPQLTTIPIGFPDSGLRMLAFPKQNVERTIEIYSNFSTSTNIQLRQECLDAFKDDPRVLRKEPQGRTREEYFNDLFRSKFVLCPEGTGIDTHRVYESIYCGATPVVLRNSLSHMYAKMPVCIVDNWTDPFYVPTTPMQFDVNAYM